MKNQKPQFGWGVLQRRSAVGCALGFFGVLVLGVCAARAEVPLPLHYQGRLLDSQGIGLNGTVAMQVRVYDAPAGGNLLYSESLGSVPVTDGFYRIAFGAAGGTLSAALTGMENHLAIVVNGVEQVERTKFHSVPFALHARESLDADPVLEDFRKIELSGQGDYGNVSPGGVARRVFTIRNTGFGRLTVTGIVAPGGFEAVGGTGELLPGETREIEVAFRPILAGSYSGNLVVQSNASGGSGVLNLRGSSQP